MDADKLEITRQTYDDRIRRGLKEARVTAWCQHPFVRSHYIHPLMSGRPDMNWLGAARTRHFQERRERALSIGCGAGTLERYALKWDVVGHFDAYDLSPGSIERARQLAAEQGLSDRVSYSVADLNRQVFPANTYDAVFADQSLHHIQDLEHVFTQVHQAMKADAVFVINEYVGPNQLQWTDEQLHHARELFARLDPRYLVNLHTGGPRIGVNRQSLAIMNKIDPTEGIRSQDIIPLLYENFEILERNDYGGTVINLVLEGIAGNFTTPEDHEVLRELCEAERQLIQSGALGSDHTFIVARRKRTG